MKNTPPTRLILVRHGETAWNLNEVYRGSVDVPLNRTGKCQAAALGKALKDEKIMAVYSSPLSRAMDTAKAVAKHHSKKVIKAPELTDIRYGEWEGVSNEEISKKHPELVNQWETAPETMRFPGGEDLTGVRKRAAGFLKEAVDAHWGETIVFSSHRAVLKVLILYCLRLGNERFWNVRLENAAYSAFDCRGGDFTLMKHNECCHLEGIRDKVLSDF